MKGYHRKLYADMINELVPDEDVVRKTAQEEIVHTALGVFDDYQEAYDAALNVANQYGQKVLIRKVDEFGKTRYALSFASGIDSNMAGEAVEPGGIKTALYGVDLGDCYNCKFIGTNEAVSHSDLVCTNPESEYFWNLPGALRCSLYQQGVDTMTAEGRQSLKMAAEDAEHMYAATCPECGADAPWSGNRDWYECPQCGAHFDPKLDSTISPETVQDIEESRPSWIPGSPWAPKQAYKTMKQHGDTDTWDVFGDNGELLMSEESYQVASNFVGGPAGEWSETDEIDMKPPNRNQQDAFGSKKASLVEKTEQAVLDWFSMQGWEVDYAGLEPTPGPGTEVMIVRPWHPMDADMPEWKELADRLPREIAGIRSALYTSDTDSIGIELMRGEELFDDMEHEHMGSLKTSAREYSTDELEQARQLGEQAFLNGKPSNPGICPELMAMLESNQVGEGLPLLDAWDKGWHGANVAADVPGWTDEENQALRDARNGNVDI